MIDTIKIQFLMPELNDLWKRLISHPEHHKIIGKKCFNGFYGMYRIKIGKTKRDHDYQIFIEGSLTKSVLGHNIGTLTHSQIQYELCRISNDFKISLERMYLRRLDVSTNIELEKPLTNYLSQIVSMPKKEKATYHDSISFLNKNTKYKLILYNKCKEFLAKRGTDLALKSAIASSGFNSEKILRLEVQMKNSAQIRQMLKRSITCKDLISYETYQKIIDYWYKEIKRINWVPPKKEIELTGKLTQKKCFGYFIQNTADETKVVDTLNHLDNYSKANPKQLKRDLFRRFQKDLLGFKSLCSNGELKEEFYYKLDTAYKLNSTITSR